MCGLAGCLHVDGSPVDGGELRSMSNAIAHRGPDGDGTHIDGSFGVVHRRLAIIDLSPGGHQPMISGDRRWALAYNGELYNYRPLRAELAALGWSFRSDSDTEVLLVAWQQWGERCVERFDGMFAFALWDADDRVLWLVRDRYGVKPLYLARSRRTVLFGSEIKGLLAHSALSPTVNREGLVEYLTFQNMFTDQTLFEGVHLLPPGTITRVTAHGSKFTTRYWDFSFEEPAQPESEETYLEELERLFRQAVSRQMVADVPVSSYLSGGMDSGSITAVAASQVRDLTTFTVGFDLRSASGLELAFDERERAEHLSYVFGTEHYEMVLKAGDMERSMAQLVWHLEDLRVGQSYPNFYAAKLASRFGKVVLAGTGGDELFAGYPWRYYRAVVNADFEQYVDKYYLFWHRLVSNSVLTRLLGPSADAMERVWTRDIMRSVFLDHADELTRPADYINHSLYFEAKTFLPGLLLVDDKLSMAHGLETRYPFLDNDLVEFAQRIPVGLKLGNLAEVVRLDENRPGPKTEVFYDNTRDGKLLLRSMMSRILPPETHGAVKQGFSGPDASWFRGESIDFVRRTLMVSDAALFDLVDRDVVHELVGEHLDGRVNRRLLIWSLLCLELWCRQFLLGEPVGDPR